MLCGQDAILQKEREKRTGKSNRLGRTHWMFGGRQASTSPRWNRFLRREGRMPVDVSEPHKEMVYAAIEKLGPQFTAAYQKKPVAHMSKPIT